MSSAHHSCRGVSLRQRLSTCESASVPQRRLCRYPALLTLISAVLAAAVYTIGGAEATYQLSFSVKQFESPEAPLDRLDWPPPEKATAGPVAGQEQAVGDDEADVLRLVRGRRVGHGDWSRQRAAIDELDEGLQDVTYRASSADGTTEQSASNQVKLITVSSASTSGLDLGDLFPKLNVKLESLSSLTCRTCQRAVRLAQDQLLRNVTETAMIKIGTTLCKTLGIQVPRVCDEIVPQFGPWALDVLVRTIVDPEAICPGLNLCPKRERSEPFIDIPARNSNTPPAEGPPIPQPPKDGGGSREKLYAVHLSDWHYDAEYKEGYEAECGEPICCRPPYSPENAPRLLGRPLKRAAGKYGDYTCDVPQALVESLFRFLPTAVPKVDVVFMTGDMPPHDIWAETQAAVLKAEDQTAVDLRRAFQDTVVFPAVGNHESAPINFYPTRKLVERGVADSIDWLYGSLANQWSSWLPENATRSLREKGCYSALIPNHPKRRVIAWNTNLGYRFNWWLLISHKEESDPDGLLSWLVNELERAENEGERVYLIGHMCPTDWDSFSWFGKEFARIVSRFSGTIAGQFYGHTHKDEYQLFFENVPGTPESSLSQATYWNSTSYGKPIGVAYVGPSLTPFKDLNPAFRLYEIDKETGTVLDHKTFSIDLEASNRDGKAEWKQLYSAKDAYKMSGVGPKDWKDLAERFDSDEDLFTSYLHKRTRRAGSASFIKLQSQNFRPRAKVDANAQNLATEKSAVACEESKKCRHTNLCNVRGGRIFPAEGCPGPEDLKGKTPWGGTDSIPGTGGSNQDRSGSSNGGTRSKEKRNLFPSFRSEENPADDRVMTLEVYDDGDQISIAGLAAQMARMVGELAGWEDPQFHERQSAQLKGSLQGLRKRGLASALAETDELGYEKPICR